MGWDYTGLGVGSAGVRWDAIEVWRTDMGLVCGARHWGVVRWYWGGLGWHWGVVKRHRIWHRKVVRWGGTGTRCGGSLTR